MMQDYALSFHPPRDHGPADARDGTLLAPPLQDASWTQDVRPTALLIATQTESDGLAGLIDAAGARLLGHVPPQAAEARLRSIVDLDLILLHCPTPDATLPRLLAMLALRAREEDVALIVSAGLETIELAYAALEDGPAHLLCDAEWIDIATATTLGLARNRADPLLQDVGRESEAARLQRLSEEVGRLARTIDSLARGHGDSLARGHGAPVPERPTEGSLSDRASPYIGQAIPNWPVPGEGSGTAGPKAGQVRELLRARRLRDQFLPGDLFADPAWDMLLDLMAARLAGDRVSVSSLCIAAAVPPTTALRWIRQLTDRGFLERQADPDDGRRVFIALSEKAASAIAQWFTASRRLLQDALL